MTRTSLAARVGSTLAGMTVASGLLLGGVASATVVAPDAVVPIGGGTNSTISQVQLDGETTTLTVVAPGDSISVHALLTLGPGVSPYWIYWAGFGWSGAASAAGCTGGTGGAGATDPADFTLTAPMEAGVYDIGANMGPDPCPWNPTPGAVIGRVVVASYDSLCDLARDYADKPGVAQGLCAKLEAASAAEQRGRDNAEANELQAFRNLVAAQTGKSLTEEEATMLTDLAGYL